jgi:type IV secretion system protein VirD4
LVWAAIAVIVGFLVLRCASWWGPPLRNVEWAALAFGVFAAMLVLRAGVVGDRGRDGLAVGAGMALAAASGAGLHALWSVLIYLWGSARAANVGSVPLATIQRLGDVASVSWAGHWGSISFWAAVAVLPLFGALAVAVPAAKRLLAGPRDVESGPWGARWMPATLLNKLASNGAGMPLGRDRRGRLLRYRSGPGWRGGHHAVVAGTRAGKGVGTVLPAILDHDGPVVVLDIKGENFAITRRWRRSLGRRVVVLNPLGVIEAGLDTFNPLDYVRPEHLSRDAAVVAEGLVKPEGGNAAHFSDLARQLLAGAIEVVVREAEPENRNLVTLADMLLGGDVVPILEGWRDAPDRVGRAAVQIAVVLLAASDRERGAVMTTVNKALGWTTSDEVRRFLGGVSDWTIDDVLENRADLYVVVPLDQVDPLSVFMRLVSTLMLGAVTRQDGYRTLPKPLLLVLDEFVRLGRMQSFEAMATVAAGAGVEAMFVTQDRGQVEAVYGREATTTLFGSCATVRVFGLGRTDTATAQWVVDALGDRTVETHGRQLSGKEKLTGSEQRTKLMSIDELLELPSDELIALFPGHRAARLKRIVSHSDREYRDKLDPNPTLRK